MSVEKDSLVKAVEKMRKVLDAARELKEEAKALKGPIPKPETE